LETIFGYLYFNKNKVIITRLQSNPSSTTSPGFARHTLTKHARYKTMESTTDNTSTHTKNYLHSVTIIKSTLSTIYYVTINKIQGNSSSSPLSARLHLPSSHSLHPPLVSRWLLPNYYVLHQHLL